MNLLSLQESSVSAVPEGLIDTVGGGLTSSFGDMGPLIAIAVGILFVIGLIFRIVRAR